MLWDPSLGGGPEMATHAPSRGSGPEGRQGRRRIVRMAAGAVVLLLAVLAVTDAGSSRGVIQGLLLWSLVAAPIAVGIVFFARFLDGAGGFLGGRSPYEGHGPDERHRR
jgi:hypothetical protein